MNVSSGNSLGLRTPYYKWKIMSSFLFVLPCAILRQRERGGNHGEHGRKGGPAVSELLVLLPRTRAGIRMPESDGVTVGDGKGFLRALGGSKRGRLKRSGADAPLLLFGVLLQPTVYEDHKETHPEQVPNPESHGFTFLLSVSSHDTQSQKSIP